MHELIAPESTKQRRGCWATRTVAWMDAPAVFVTGASRLPVAPRTSLNVPSRGPGLFCRVLVLLVLCLCSCCLVLVLVATCFLLLPSAPLLHNPWRDGSRHHTQNIPPSSLLLLRVPLLLLRIPLPLDPLVLCVEVSSFVPALSSWLRVLAFALRSSTILFYVLLLPSSFRRCIVLLLLRSLLSGVTGSSRRPWRGSPLPLPRVTPLLSSRGSLFSP